MRKLLLNPTPLFRKLRQLSMLLTLLLALPQTAWGQTTYNIGTYNSQDNTWGDWQVTASNTTLSSPGSNLLSFTVASKTTATITLTLTHPGNTSEKICSASFSYNNQDSNIPDDNKVKLLSAKIVHTQTNSESDLTDDFNKGPLYCNFYAKTPIEWSTGDKFVVTLQVNNTTDNETRHGIQAAELKTGTPYGLVVNGITVTNVNQDCVTNIVDEVIFTPEEGSNPATLKLNEAKLDVTSANIAAIESSLRSLKVILAGANTITCGNNKAFNLAANSTLNFTTNGTNSGQLTITSTSSITTESFYSPSTATVTYTGLVASNPTSTSVLISPPTSYDITIAGVAVTNANASAITGTGITGTVSYDATTNTLTLTDAGISSDYNALTYSGNTLLKIALNGTNSITATNGTYTINTTGSGNIKFVKATGASTAAKLTVSSGDGSLYVFNGTNPSLGSGLYWKPMAGNQMVITEDPEFIIIDNLIMTDNRTVSGDNSTGTITYSSSNKTLTIDGFQKNFGTKHAIKTGVSGLKVKLIGASTINCSADSAVFHAFSSSASIQFIKDDPTSKLTMTGKDYNNFGSSSITYDGLFHYSDNTNKVITQAAAPELGKLPKVDAGSYYTFATIDYADSDKSGSDAIYKDASPVLKYSFDYADSQKQDVSDQAYPAEGIKMTDPGILTAWVEVGTYKGPEAKGVRFGFIENPIEMEFNGTEKQINVTPAPTMTNAVTPSVSSDYSALFNNFGTLDAANKITIKSCYDGKIGFIFNNSDVGYTSLNDSTLVTFKITPPKPTISVPGGTYDAAQTVSIVSNYQGTGATIKYYFDPTAEQTYSADLSITETKTLTAWVEVNGVKSDTVQAPYTIRQAANLSYSATSATANIHESSITFTPPTLSNPSQVAVTYSSSNTAVATINTTGDVTIVGAGVTTISAKPTDETLYIPTPATYELTVTRDFNNPFANQPAEQIYATYYNVYEDLTLPDGIAAYVITGISGNTVTTTATGYLPHEVPVLLEKTGNVGTTITGYTGSAGNFSGNLLKYADQPFSSTGKEYVLYMNEFVKATGNIPDSKCYLDLSSVNPSRGMYGIGDGTTSIRELRMENEGRDEWYDLQGRRIEQPTKAGLYIKNGKKVIVNIK